MTSKFGSIFKKATFSVQESLGKALIAKAPLLNGQTPAKEQVREQNEKRRVSILRNQKKEYINGKKMSLLKLPNSDFPVREIIFPVLTGEVCYRCWRAEDRECPVLPGTFGRPCISARRPPPAGQHG